MALLRSRALWLGLLVMALAFGASWELRALFVEPSEAALVCNAAPHPSWCVVRFAILAGQHNALFGAAALIAAAVALFRGRRGFALAAAGLAVVAMVNYNVEMGALALVLGLIASVGAPRRRVRATRV